jgi:hypothetical protein
VIFAACRFSRFRHAGANARFTAVSDPVAHEKQHCQEAPMLRSDSNDWPFRCEHLSPRRPAHPLPSRLDIALAAYLEKQEAQRASTSLRFDLGAAAIALWLHVAAMARALAGSRRQWFREI